ncbi:MAG: toll/interleukin-1 receptor domain-containing protein [Ginsengibacter sp.]
MQQANYFFSYSRKDADFVKKLATDLKKTGASVWLDQLDIAPGSPWDDSIQNALNGSQGLIVILSDDSVKSKNVMDEVSYAMSQGKKVVPLVIEECPVPFRLARLQYIDFKGDYDSSFANLLNALNTPDAQPLQSSTQSTNKSYSPEAKKSSLKTFILPVIILAVALIVFVLFKNNKDAITTSTNARDTAMPAGQHNKVEQANKTNDQQANDGKAENLPVQNTERKVAPNADRINLFAPESGSEILVASNDDWKNTIDGKEERSYINSGIGKEAVYGFKGERLATFDTFTMLISETADYNVKDFELFAGNDAPLGSFQSIGKFQTQNLKLFRTPYQEFKFAAVTAKYFKVKLLSSYSSGYPAINEFQLFGSLK